MQKDRPCKPYSYRFSLKALPFSFACLLALFLATYISISTVFAAQATHTQKSNNKLEYTVQIQGITGEPLKNIQQGLSVLRYKDYIAEQTKLRLPLYFQQG
ncbi:hypothetical protein [Piscirickettsia litoralis]|uniref:hypothetical protein n=1 Tax=Piscirickettsia litoralis TaxID=1891921 RepID=UPI001F2EFF93|nr:hypothetical protein [Piscirickettsia litoralis]